MKIGKIAIIAGAAAAAAVVCFGGWFNGAGTVAETETIRIPPYMDTSVVTTGANGQDETADAEKHGFSLGILSSAGGKEEIKTLEKNRVVPLQAKVDNGWSIGWDGVGAVDYLFGTSFLCEGEGIERIRYAIHGAKDSDKTPLFQIVTPQGDGFVLEGVENDSMSEDFGAINGDVIDADGDGEGETYISQRRYYTEFTLDYHHQQDEHTWINVCGEKNIENPLRLFYADGMTITDECAAINDILDGVIITCTAVYEDGTEESVNISMRAQVMTFREAGEDAPEALLDEEVVYLLFELQ